MGGSEYEVNAETGHVIRRKLKKFLDEHPPGSKFTIDAEGERYTLLVTRFSRCPEDIKESCEVELQDERYGGYANYYAKIVGDEAEIRISEADFPHPLEIIIAQKTMDIPIVESKDYCIKDYGEEATLFAAFCSKRRW